MVWVICPHFSKALAEHCIIYVFMLKVKFIKDTEYSSHWALLRSPELKNLLEFKYLPDKSWNSI